MIKSHYFEIVGFFIVKTFSIFAKNYMKNFLFLGLIGTTVFLNSCSSSKEDTPINSPNDISSRSNIILK